MNEEQAIAKSAADLMLALGMRPIRNGSMTLHFSADGLLEEVETKTKRRVRRAGPNHQPARTSGST